jgi:tRNA (cmo5U34)-methyltransferase
MDALTGAVEGCLACELADGRRELRGGRIHESQHWLVEHCVGPLGVGTLVVKPHRHVVHVWQLTVAEAAELGPLLRRVSEAVARLAKPDQVYVCLWSHAGGEPGHIHFVVQPAWSGPQRGAALQAAMFNAGEEPTRAEVEAFAERARELLGEDFEPDGYLESIQAEIPRFGELQAAVADAAQGLRAQTVLELGTGTGETARRVLELYPEASFVGLDASGPMLDRARQALPAGVDLRVARLQDPLPDGTYDLVFSAFTVHHLDGNEKADLFRRIAALLRPGGRFVLGDVILPDRPEDAVTPLTEGFDVPDRIEDQLEWLVAAGLRPSVTWSWKDLAVIAADLG